jgi:hypothetical protein
MKSVREVLLALVQVRRGVERMVAVLETNSDVEEAGVSMERKNTHVLHYRTSHAHIGDR